MPKAYSYIRMSTLEQLKGHSAARQYEAAEKYAEENGLVMQDIIEDIGVSAFKGNNARNGELAVFLKAVKSGKIDQGSYLIVESLDRLSRDDILPATTLLTDIIGSGIIVVTLLDEQKFSKEAVTTNPFMLVQALTIMVRANDESKTKSKRQKSVWAKKRTVIQSGKPTPQRLPAWLSYSHHKNEIVMNEERCKLIIEIIELSRDGYGAYSIARLLNERGEKPWGSPKQKKGKQKKPVWYESYIKKILTNRAVLGEFQPRKFAETRYNKTKVSAGDMCPNYYPKVVDDNLFAASQLAISKRKVTGAGRKGKKNSNLFSGLLICKSCGSGISYINKGAGPKGGKYLRCSSSHLNAECNEPAWRYSDVESSLINALHQIDFEAVLNDTNSKLEKLTSTKFKLESEVTKARSDIAIFSSAMLEADKESTSLLLEITNLEEQILTKESEIKTIQSKINAIESAKPKQRRKAVDQILASLNDTSDASKIVKMRKKLGAELRLMISHIELGSTTEELAEFFDPENQKPDWFLKLNMDWRKFKKHYRRFGYEISIRYESNKTTIIKSLEDKILNVQYGEKVKLWSKIKSLPTGD